MKMRQSDEIDALCDEWSDRWQSDDMPNLQEFAAAINPELRDAALQFLIPIDVQQRRRRQPGLSVSEYAALGPAARQLAARYLLSSETAEQRQRADKASAIFQFSEEEIEVPAVLLKPTAGLPQKVGMYRVLEPIGAGGMGVVMKAEHGHSGEPAAIKFLRPELSGSLEVRRRFLREAAAIGSVKHPNVVRVLHVEHQPILCLVMEYVRGRTLQERLQEAGTLPLSELLLLGLQITEGLEAIHRQGIIHRDLKPQNILLQEVGQLWAQITDFGVARFTGDAQITRSGEIVGTAGWLSPEQAQDQSVTARSDLFSLGCVLYAMACGQSPFQRAGLTPTLMAVIQDPVVPVSCIRPDLPGDVCRLIEWLLEKPERRRPRTASVVRRAFQRFLTTYSINSVRLPSHFPGENSGSGSEKRWSRRGLLLSAAAAVVLPVCAGLPLLLRGQRGAVTSGGPLRGQSSAIASESAVRRPAVPRTPPPLHADASPEQAAKLSRQWSELLELPLEIAGPAGLKFLMIPPLLLPAAQQQTGSSCLPAFYTATRPVSWQQFHGLLQNEAAALLLARLSNSQATAPHQSAKCTAEQALDCVRHFNGNLREIASSPAPAAGFGRLVGRLPWDVEWQMLNVFFERSVPLLAGLERPDDDFCCWLQSSQPTQPMSLQISFGGSSNQTTKLQEREPAGLWLICGGEVFQEMLSSAAFPA